MIDSLRSTSLGLLVLFLMLIANSGITNASPSIIPSEPTLAASSWIMIDANSGKVLAESNADERLPPASLTKLMTSYVLSYEEAAGRANSSDIVTVSRNAWAQNFPGSSLMWIEVGKEVSVDDLHKGIIISSGNDASVAVAEYLAGTQDAFAQVMNEHAKRLGMTNTHYANAHGLPAEGHLTTARDLALLSNAIIQDFPKDYELYSEKSFTYNNIKTPNRNRLLWRDSTVDGLKTGHTKEAGYCLVASAKQDEMRLITVVLGAKSDESRMAETQKLLSYGFRYYETHQLYKANEVLNQARVWGGDKKTVNLGLKDAVWLTIPRGQQSNVKAELKIDSVIKGAVVAGEKHGVVSITLNDELLQEVPLVALESVDKAGFFASLIDSIKLFFFQVLQR